MISKSEDIKELVKSLIQVQAKIKPAIKDTVNPYFKSTYADLTSVWDACRKLLSENNLAIIQAIDTKDNILSVITMLTHTSGQWVSSNISSNIDKLTPQQIGSMITYYKRYGLASMVGVTTEDDDGNGASKGDNKSDTREKQNSSSSGSSSKINTDTRATSAEQSAKPNGAELSKGTNSAPNKPSLDLEQLSKIKFTGGQYVGNTFEQVFQSELKSNHKWSKQRLKEIKEGLPLPEIAIKYLDYAKALGAQL